MFHFSDDEKQLSCKGFKIDVIDGVGCRYVRSTDSYAQGSVVQPLHKMNRYGDDKGLSDALRRTLFLNHPSQSHTNTLLQIPWCEVSEQDIEPPCNPRCQGWNEIYDGGYYPAFHDFRRANEVFQISDREFKDFFPGRLSYQDKHWDTAAMSADVRWAVISLIGRRLVTTATGYLGLAVEAVEPGDVVAFLAGCHFPVVLRSDGEMHKVVGECYVNGLMEGEIWEEYKSGNCVLDDLRYAKPQVG